MQQITDEFNIGRTTFYRALAQSRRENMLEQAKDAILGLIPKAIQAYDAALSKGDTDVATAVLEGAGVIGKHMFLTPPPGSETDVTFTQLRARIIRKVTGVDVTGELDDVPVLEGRVSGGSNGHGSDAAGGGSAHAAAAANKASEQADAQAGRHHPDERPDQGRVSPDPPRTEESLGTNHRENSRERDWHEEGVN